MSLFIPKMYQKDIFSIDYKLLKEKNIKLIIFDLDNTIGRVKDNVCDEVTAKFINNLNKDFIIIVSSNSLKKRVLSFCEPLECGKFYFSLKPCSFILKKIKKKYKINYKNMAIIGDQMLTDIFLGNRFGLMTILVSQKDKYDLANTRINRKIEKIIKQKYKFKNGEYYK